MAVKDGTTLTTDITTKAREVDFVTRFQKTWDDLREIIGIARPVVKTPGAELVTYDSSMTLESGSVAEGDEIPYSKATVKPIYRDKITLGKYAKAVSLEAVEEYGATVAIQKTDEAFLNELQGVVMDKFFAFLQTGTLTGNYSTFQMGVAMAIGMVRDKFKKLRRNVGNIVVICNILDLYEYIGSAEITVQTNNGITYLQNFMGAQTVILSSDIPRGKIIGVPADNLVMYYIDPAAAEVRQLGLEYNVASLNGEAAATNLIGFHVEGKYSHALGEAFAIMGLVLWAEYLDGISVITFGSDTTGE